jgi:hypothetical protein
MKKSSKKKIARDWGFAGNWARGVGFMQRTIEVAKNLWISAGGAQWERYDFGGEGGDLGQDGVTKKVDLEVD